MVMRMRYLGPLLACLATVWAALGCHQAGSSDADPPAVSVDMSPGQAAVDPPSSPAPAAAGAEEPPASQQPQASPPGNAARTPSDQVLDITFDDLKLDMPPDSRFAPELLTQRVKELDGRRVRIRGFISPAIFQLEGITQFPLLRNTQCKFGPGGQAFCVILVFMREGHSVKFTVQPIGLEGILRVEPFEGPDGNTWAVYRMDDAVPLAGG